MRADRNAAGSGARKGRFASLIRFAAPNSTRFASREAGISLPAPQRSFQRALHPIGVRQRRRHTLLGICEAKRRLAKRSHGSFCPVNLECNVLPQGEQLSSASLARGVCIRAAATRNGDTPRSVPPSQSRTTLSSCNSMKHIHCAGVNKNESASQNVPELCC